MWTLPRSGGDIKEDWGGRATTHRPGRETLREKAGSILWSAYHGIYLPSGPAARFGPLYDKPT